VRCAQDLQMQDAEHSSILNFDYRQAYPNKPKADRDFPLGNQHRQQNIAENSA
jgi:hypothetical protein